MFLNNIVYYYIVYCNNLQYTILYIVTLYLLVYKYYNYTIIIILLLYNVIIIANMIDREVN